MYCKIFALMSAVAMALASAASSSGAEFQELSLDHPANTLAMTEDGLHVVVGHESADRISVVSTKTGELVKQMQTTRPKAILCRGNQVFVANYGEGTISVFRVDKNWELNDQLAVGAENPYYLSAPQGKNFAGLLVATCEGAERYGNLSLLIDIKKDKYSRFPVSGMATTVDYDGRYVIWQGYGGSPSRAIEGGMDYRALVGGRQTPSVGRGWDTMPIVVQVRSGAYWFGGGLICKGMLPRPVGEGRGKFVVPDRMQDTCYVVTPDSVKCLALDPALTEVGEQQASYPPQYGRMRPDGPFINARDSEGFDYLHVAATLDDHLYLYLWDNLESGIYWCKTEAFPLPAGLVKAASGTPARGASRSARTPSGSQPPPAPAPDAMQLPERIVAGKTLNFELPQAAEYDLMSGPSGAKITSQGVLTWTPTQQEMGAQQLKIKLRLSQGLKIVRLTTEVVDVDLPAGSDLDAAELGLHELIGPAVSLAHSLDGQSVLLCNGHRFVELDKGGLTVRRTHEFDSRYSQLLERERYYVALADVALDLIDKQSLAVRKSIPLDSEAAGLAIRPGAAISYVAVPTRRGEVRNEAQPILEVDEQAGAVRPLANIRGTMLVSDPAGRRLFVGLNEVYEDGWRRDPITGRLVTQYGNDDLLTAYDLTGAAPRRLGENEQPGANGRRLVIAPDGRHVAYVSGGGAPGTPYSIASYSAEQVDREASRYQIAAYPSDACYHPTADLVACTNGGQIWLFRRGSGQELLDVLPAGVTFKNIQRIVFAPGGDRLLVVHEHPQRSWTLESVALRLSKEDRTAIAAGFPVPQPATPTPAATAAPELRTWTDSTGAFSVEAQLVKVTGGKVVLKRTDGPLATVPIGRLSDADRQYLKARLGPHD